MKHILVVLLLVSSCLAASFSTVQEFTAATGTSPQGALVVDAQGNFYGTNSQGGANGCGTVFELTRDQVIDLYDFTCGEDGGHPVGTLLLSGGNLYGTTPESVFEISGGEESTLYYFGAVGVGDTVAMDSQGNLYGTTELSGTGYECDHRTHPCGTFWELSGGTLITLHNFCQSAGCDDGSYPLHGAVIDAGVVYGTTSAGGGMGYGTVFSYTQGYLARIHSFMGTDGENPNQIMFDKAGNIYGTAKFGGRTGCGSTCGTILKLWPTNTFWQEKTLHEFGAPSESKAPNKGDNPYGGVVLDASGNVYGTAYDGGHFDAACPEGCGTVFELSGTTWTTFWKFGDVGSSFPMGTAVFGSDGNLYGTAAGDGVHSLGSIWKVVF